MVQKVVDGQIVDMTDADIAQMKKDINLLPPGAQKFLISKAEMWRRCNEDEAEGLYADLRQAPSRLQGLFDGAQVIDVRDDFYATLKAIIEARVGVDRAAVILAPTS